jgi:hypothetical protein
MKKTIMMITIIMMIAAFGFAAKDEATVSITLKIGAVKEVTVLNESVQSDQDGMKIDFEPNLVSDEGYEENFGVSLTTNARFTIAYYWENETTVDEGISACLKLDEKAIKEELIRKAGSYEAYVEEHLKIGNGSKRTQITSDELSFRAGKLDLNFNLAYDPTLSDGKVASGENESTLRIIITFPPMD